MAKSRDVVRPPMWGMEDYVVWLSVFIQLETESGANLLHVVVFYVHVRACHNLTCCSLHLWGVTMQLIFWEVDRGC